MTEPVGYLFAYFDGGTGPDAAQVRFAVSEGADALRWRALNDGAPILRNTLGSGGARDPFLIRGPGGRVWCLATDQHEDAAGRSIVVWCTDDLEAWSLPRLLTVAPPDADARAPKAVLDPVTGEFTLLFSSAPLPVTVPAGGADAEVVGRRRILAVRTRDFAEVSAPEVYLDRPGDDTGAVALLESGGTVHRFFPAGGFVTHERRDPATGAFVEVRSGIGAGDLGHADGPAVFAGLGGRTWYLFLDDHGGRGYHPFVTRNLTGGGWQPVSEHGLPAGARHGSVLPITEPEFSRLEALIGGPEI